MWQLFVIGVVALYEFVVLPQIIRTNIQSKVQSLGGQMIRIKSLSRRESLYVVEYKIDEKYLKSTAKCNLIGYIVRWI